MHRPTRRGHSIVVAKITCGPASRKNEVGRTNGSRLESQMPQHEADTLLHRRLTWTVRPAVHKPFGVNVFVPIRRRVEQMPFDGLRFPIGIAAGIEPEQVQFTRFDRFDSAVEKFSGGVAKTRARQNSK